MRGALLAAVLTLAPMMAMADESVSGQWQADLGHNVLIAMDVLADGHWSSQTVQNDKVVAELAGTYDQKKANDTSGTIVFKPVTAKTSPQHGQRHRGDGQIHPRKRREDLAPRLRKGRDGLSQATVCGVGAAHRCARHSSPSWRC